MRVIVCGSRTWWDRAAVFAELDRVFEHACRVQPGEGLAVVHGGARGADLMAHEWAEKHRGAHPLCYEAKWRELGKRAGPERNQRMADAGADVCLAFWDGESRGTMDMIRRAVLAGIPVKVRSAHPNKALLLKGRVGA